jgi:hypothetical protein
VFISHFFIPSSSFLASYLLLSASHLSFLLFLLSFIYLSCLNLFCYFTFSLNSLIFHMPRSFHLLPRSLSLDLLPYSSTPFWLFLFISYIFIFLPLFDDISFVHSPSLLVISFFIFLPLISPHLFILPFLPLFQLSNLTCYVKVCIKMDRHTLLNEGPSFQTLIYITQ